jgi:hypothetical protein
MSEQRPATRASLEVDAFLADLKVHKEPSVSGRLIFALDATMSRQETWDAACHLQGDMFRTVASIGGLSVQLVYYRDHCECRSSKWVTDSVHLASLMTRIQCRAGHTQIGKVLTHAKRETELLKVAALVFVGDAFEEEEDEVIALAHELGRLGLPIFMFQEGNDTRVERIFRAITKASNGAHCRFDPGAARQLGELLKAVAAFATGGLAALAARKDASAVKLLSQMTRS